MTLLSWALRPNQGWGKSCNEINEGTVELFKPIRLRIVVHAAVICIKIPFAARERFRVLPKMAATISA